MTIDPEPLPHIELVRDAYGAAVLALWSAKTRGERTDCLTCAVRDLRGALRNLEALAARPDLKT